MYDQAPSKAIEAVVFHDADTLEFLGVIGITRILSIVGLDDWTPDLKSAVGLIRRFSQELPEKLVTPLAKESGLKRKWEMQDFLRLLESESFGNGL